jgi:hypothetical protein
MPTPNFYVERDIGNKKIRSLNGKVQSVKTHKIKDTAGTTFYTFPNAPLS